MKTKKIRNNVDKEETLKCGRCQKLFKSAKNLDVHLWRHLGILCCKVCDAKFWCLSDLRNHEREKHQDKCVLIDKKANKICGKAFASKNNIRQHKKIHKKGMRFE